MSQNFYKSYNGPFSDVDNIDKRTITLLHYDLNITSDQVIENIKKEYGPSIDVVARHHNIR